MLLVTLLTRWALGVEVGSEVQCWGRVEVGQPLQCCSFQNGCGNQQRLGEPLGWRDTLDKGFRDSIWLRIRLKATHKSICTQAERQTLRAELAAARRRLEDAEAAAAEAAAEAVPVPAPAGAAAGDAAANQADAAAARAAELEAELSRAR